MIFHTRLRFLLRGIVLLFLVLLLIHVGLAQNETQDPGARVILRSSEAQQKEFVQRFLAERLPDRDGDKFSALLANRSDLVLPILESWVEDELKRRSPDQRLIDIGGAMVAYAGDREALLAVGKLLKIDEAGFIQLVERTLDNAGNWRNPFNVLYDGLAIGDGVISRRTMQWVVSALASKRMQRAWAEALLDRYRKVPSDAEWATDPIVSRLSDRTSPELRPTILGIAEDASRKRERR
jgi:hypothetical protein